jgi:DNA-binding Xre family transcriptional regulator
MASTFDREMQNAKFKKIFESEYNELVLSELILAIMEEDHKTVRQLAQEINVSPTIIQKLRSGNQKDIKVKNFLNILKACGYKIFIEKNRIKIPLFA